MRSTIRGVAFFAFFAFLAGALPIPAFGQLREDNPALEQMIILDSIEQSEQRTRQFIDNQNKMLENHRSMERQNQPDANVAIISSMILSGNCENARNFALANSRIDLADQVHRLCRPKSALSRGAAAQTSNIDSRGRHQYLGHLEK